MQICMRQADALLQRLESSRDLTRTIVHVDMDAFYAAVEMLDNPKLKTVPLAVGGNSMLVGVEIASMVISSSLCQCWSTLT